MRLKQQCGLQLYRQPNAQMKYPAGTKVLNYVEHNNKGNDYYAIGNVEKAFEEYDKAISHRPDVVPYYNRGLLNYEQNAYDKAIQDFDKCIEIGGLRAAAISHNRGNAYYAKGDFNKAIENYLDACLLSAKSQESCSQLKYIHFDIGNTYYAKENFVEAIKAYNLALKKVVEQDKSLRQSLYHNLGNTYYAQVNFDKAIDNYSAAIDCDPTGEKSADSFNNRGNAYYAKAKLAQEQWERAEQKNGKQAKALLAQAQEYLSRAISDYNAALLRAPEHTQAWANLKGIYENELSTLSILEKDVIFSLIQFLSPAKQIKLLAPCLVESKTKSSLAERFWAKEGVRECHPDHKGSTLYKIKKHLLTLPTPVEDPVKVCLPTVVSPISVFQPHEQKQMQCGQNLALKKQQVQVQRDQHAAETAAKVHKPSPAVSSLSIFQAECKPTATYMPNAKGLRATKLQDALGFNNPEGLF